MHIQSYRQVAEIQASPFPLAAFTRLSRRVTRRAFYARVERS
jgi:hypothetical protein